MTFPWNGIIGTNSQSLLDMLNGENAGEHHNDIPIPIYNGEVILDVICPDWDVVVEIQRALKNLPNIKLTFVKGHQDPTTAYENLDLMAQLNVDADAKAKEFQDAYGAHRPIAKMMSATGAHLVGPTGTITSHYPKNMRYHANAAPLRSYMLCKYHWSPFDTVHWEAHGVALKKANKQRIHYTKLVFDILPTHSQANRYDRGTRKCPSCDHLSETRDHILRCESLSAVKWRDEFFLELNQLCRRTQTAPELKHLRTAALTKWFGSGDDISMDPAAYSESVYNLILEQNEIGWRQLFNGPFSREWSKVQQSQYHRLSPRQEGQRRRTGDRWQAQLITMIWRERDKRWRDRNQAVHGSTADTRYEEKYGGNWIMYIGNAT